MKAAVPLPPGPSLPGRDFGLPHWLFQCLGALEQPGCAFPAWRRRFLLQ